jgi:hypothetical protein
MTLGRCYRTPRRITMNSTAISSRATGRRSSYEFQSFHPHRSTYAISRAVGRHLPPRAEVHKIPARVQCTVQVCELAASNQHPPPYRSRQIICLSHSRVHSPSPHQLHPRPGPSIPCTHARHSSTHHRTLCAVQGLCTSVLGGRLCGTYYYTLLVW